jgi:tetratricopeptide (TPR) repeat protein
MIDQQSLQKIPVGAGWWKQHWRVPAVCLVLAAITFAVFGQTVGFEFVNYDDDLYVYENAKVEDGLSLKGLAWVFTHTDCYLYHPLTMLSLMGNYQLHGLHAGWYHFTNVLLHTASVILLFLILRQMTGALWRSAFVAAVFAIHPLRVESVAWVAERKDVLSAFFFMLTIGAYVRYARHPWSLAHYGLVMLLFALGLMCKPTVVTLPFVLLLLDYWPLHRFEQPRKLSGLILEKIPLLALAAGASVITTMTVLAAGNSIPAVGHISMASRVGNALVSYAVYLRQMVWPEGLAAPYPYSHYSPPPWEVALAGTLLASLSAVTWRERRTRPWLLIGWLWYLGMLAPMIGIVQASNFAHADRYTYLPQIGIYLAVTWLAAEWGAKWHAGRAVIGGLMTAVIAMLMVCAWKQTTYWKNSETLWTHTLACTADNDVAHLNLGVDLAKKARVDEAIAHYQKALQINPRYAQAHFNLGNALRKKGSVDEEIAQYQMALQIKPNHAQARNNLGNVFDEQGRLDEAIAQFQKALQIQPDYADAHYNLGVSLRKQGRLDEAIAQYQKALQIQPGFAEAEYNLGSVFDQQGRLDEAITHYQKALQLKPAEPSVQNNLAWVLATCPEASLRDGNKAVELARQANGLTGGENPIVLHTLAAAYAEAGRFSEAVETAQHALRLAEAQSNASLAGQLQLEMKLYQAGSPFHTPPQTH